MLLTLQLQLLPTSTQAAQLRKTMAQFNAAASWVASQAFRVQSANKIALQKTVYYPIREQFGLSAQMAVRAIAQACEAYKRDRTIQPTFRPDAAMPYDQRLLSFKGLDRASLLTLDGRILVPLVMGRYQRERFTAAARQSDLVHRHDGKWFLLVTVSVPDGTPIQTTDFLGVDFGIVNLAADSDGTAYSGAAVEHVRRKHAKQRRALQRRNTRGAKKKLKRIAKKESQFRRHENHRISKQIVKTAKDTARGIGVETLTHIRTRTTVKRKDRNRQSGWAFAQLRGFVEYKAQLDGVPIVAVDARNTSRTCSHCGHCEKANRKSQAEFFCLHCHLSINADLNAALNIAFLAQGVAVNHPQNCRLERAS